MVRHTSISKTQHLNANNYTFGANTPTPIIHFHEFGGTVGGPILRNKFFFFFNYDHIIDNGGTAASFYTVPTAAELSRQFCRTAPHL